MKLFLKIIVSVIALLTLFIVVLVIRTVTHDVPNQISYQKSDKEIIVNDDAVERFREALRIPTVSYQDPTLFDAKAFKDFGNWIDNSYPEITRTLEKKVINQYSYLYKWQGSDPTLRPVIISGHYDVVPAPEDWQGKWDHPPFGAEIDNGVIYARGAIDMKNAIVGTLEAVSSLIKQGFEPKRTLYLSFNHDEELAGFAGARNVVQYLEEAGIDAEFVLEEGGLINSRNGVKRAAIALSEKGFGIITLTVTMSPGHSAYPGEETSITVLTKALVAIQENPYPIEINPVMSKFLDIVAIKEPFVSKFFMVNRDIFEKPFLKVFLKNPLQKALVTTTIVPTIIQTDSSKVNVIPRQTIAYLSVRPNVDDSFEEIAAYLKETINDERVKIEYDEKRVLDLISVADIDGYGYSKIAQTIQENYEDVDVVPFLTVASTDGKWFSRIYPDRVYRFNPFVLGEHNANIFHGDNERIPIEEFKDQIRFYIRLIENIQN